jgi:hypothetical protein
MISAPTNSRSKYIWIEAVIKTASIFLPQLPGTAYADLARSFPA